MQFWHEIIVEQPSQGLPNFVALIKRFYGGSVGKKITSWAASLRISRDGSSS
jgi:hypothetical protein